MLQLVKDIRRLVDSGEFLANRHCKSSPVVKLIITLLLEFITDHSREVKAEGHVSANSCYTSRIPLGKKELSLLLSSTGPLYSH